MCLFLFKPEKRRESDVGEDRNPGLTPHPFKYAKEISRALIIRPKTQGEPSEPQGPFSYSVEGHAQQLQEGCAGL